MPSNSDSLFPIGQDFLMAMSEEIFKDNPRVLEQLGNRGLCYGVSHVVMLLGWDRAREILAKIATSDPVDLNKQIDKVAKKRMSLMRKYEKKLDALDEHAINKQFKEMGLATEMSSHERRELRSLDLEMQTHKKKRMILRALVSADLSSEDKLILDIPTIFQAIALIHKPKAFSSGLFGKKILNQEATAILPLVMPRELESRGGVEMLPESSICLTQRHFTKILNTLNGQLKKQKPQFEDSKSTVTFHLKNHNHAIFISYFPNEGVWQFFDPNNVSLADRRFSSHDLNALSNLVFVSFSNAYYPNGQIPVLDPGCYGALSIQPASLAEYSTATQAVLDGARRSKKWRRIMEVTEANTTAACWREQVRWLHVAVICGDRQAVERLIKFGVNVNQVDINGATPLFVAAREGKTKIVESLIAAHAEVNQPDKFGITPLFTAAKSGHTDIAKRLIEAGANPEACLFLAIKLNDVEVVKGLIKVGVNINHADDHGVTPLFLAAQNGQKRMVRVIASAGALVDEPLKSDYGATALFVAAQQGNTSIVERLIALGAKVDIPLEKNGNTPLKMAVLNGHAGVVEALVAANADSNKADKDGLTPLFCAVVKGATEMVSCLLGRGEGLMLGCQIKSDVLQGIVKESLPEIQKRMRHFIRRQTDVLLSRIPPIDKSEGIKLTITPHDMAIILGHKEIADQIHDHSKRHESVQPPVDTRVKSSNAM